MIVVTMTVVKTGDATVRAAQFLCGVRSAIARHSAVACGRSRLTGPLDSPG
jgi:hypothetical protein